ncbi:FeoB-associated Cys-rich membrane protein [Pedobacter immunditicola]|uniref:FeoB-associated Cys-rich membrane protein n=1 Tax=Pedobacter immunditicola TaxID=3133440 RepID=UPI00309BFD99
MDIQTILVILLFLAAIFYIGRSIYRSGSEKGGSCGSCGSNKCKVDFSKIDSPKGNL